MRHRLFGTILRIWLPLLLLAGVQFHHHESAKDADHCEICANTVVSRRRSIATASVLELSVGGGRPTHQVERALLARASTHHPQTASIGADVPAINVQSWTAIVPDQPLITRTIVWRGDAPVLRGPPQPVSPRAPPVVL